MIWWAGAILLLLVAVVFNLSLLAYAMYALLAVLVVSHYLSIVREFADHALLLDADAQQVVVGTPAQVFEHATFRKRYGDSVPPSAEERRV